MANSTDGSVPMHRRTDSPAARSEGGIETDRPAVLGTIGPDGTDRLAPARTPTSLSRQQILDATADCMRDLGYDGTTIRRIAKCLDCAVGSIYRYFEDKRALQAQVVQRRFEPVAERIEAGDPVEGVAEFYAMTARDQPELYRLMFWLASIGKKDYGNSLPEVIQRIIGGWERQLGDRRLAESYWSQLHGAIMQGRGPQDLLTPTALADALAPRDRRPSPDGGPTGTA